MLPYPVGSLAAERRLILAAPTYLSLRYRSATDGSTRCATQSHW